MIASHPSSHEGTTPKGQTLDDFLGSSYNKEFLPFFDKFLGAVYGAEFISLLKLVKTDICIDKKACDSRSLLGLSHEGTPDISNEASTTGSTGMATKEQHGPSEYELRRKANIEENQRLLASLGLSGGGSSIIDKQSSKGKKKKGAKGERYFGLFCCAFPSMI